MPLSLLNLDTISLRQIILYSIEGEVEKEALQLNVLSVVCKHLLSQVQSDDIWLPMARHWKIVLCDTKEVRKKIKTIVHAILAIPNIAQFEALLPLWQLDLLRRHLLPSCYPITTRSTLQRGVALYQFFSSTFQKVELHKILRRGDFHGILSNHEAHQLLRKNAAQKNYLLRLGIFTEQANSTNGYLEIVPNLEELIAEAEECTKLMPEAEEHYDVLKKAKPSLKLEKTLVRVTAICKTITARDFFILDVLPPKNLSVFHYTPYRASQHVDESANSDQTIIPISISLQQEQTTTPLAAESMVDKLLKHIEQIHIFALKRYNFYFVKYRNHDLATFYTSPLPQQQPSIMQIQQKHSSLPAAVIQTYCNRTDFHGELDREQVEELLRNNLLTEGSIYLLRLSPEKINTIILSILLRSKEGMEKNRHCFFDRGSSKKELSASEITSAIERIIQDLIHSTAEIWAQKKMDSPPEQEENRPAIEALTIDYALDGIPAVKGLCHFQL